MKELKFLFETVIKKQVDYPTFEKSTDKDGKEVEIKRILKKLTPVKVAILKPDRKLFKSAEIFYSKTLAEYLKAGLLPYSLVAKRYANDGGPLSDIEKARIETLKEKATQLEQEFFTKVGEAGEASNTETQTKKNELLVQINNINNELGQIQNAYSDIFESTAEMKSRTETMEWWSFHLMYIDEDGKGYKPLFGEGDYDTKVSKLESFEEQNNDFYNEIIKRLSYLVSFWFTARNVVTSNEFATMEKLYLENFNSYNPVDENIPSVIVSETLPISNVRPSETPIVTSSVNV